MVRRGDVAAVGLALAGTEAADFTGPAAGHAVEVALGSMVTVVLARRPATPKGTAHVRSFLVAGATGSGVAQCGGGLVARRLRSNT